MLPLLLRALRSPDCCILIAYFLSHSKFDGCLDNVRKKNWRRIARLVGKLMARTSSAREEVLTAPTRELQVVDTTYFLYIAPHTVAGTQFFIKKILLPPRTFRLSAAHCAHPVSNISMYYLHSYEESPWGAAWGVVPFLGDFSCLS